MAVEYLQENGVGRVAINNRGSKNALKNRDVELITEFIQSASEDVEVDLIVFDSKGDFCSGVNLTCLDAVGRGQDWDELGDYIEETFLPLVKSLRESKKPTLAILDGVVAGAGLSLALHCDFRIAIESARVIPSFNRLGFIPDCLGGWLLPRMIGVQRSMEFYGLGKEISGKEASDIGLANLSVSSREDTMIDSYMELIRTQSSEALVNLRNILNSSFVFNEHQYFEMEKSIMTSLYKTDFTKNSLSSFRKNK